MKRALLAALVAAQVAACGDFERPSIVLDLRVLGIQAEPPEVVSPFDPDNPDDLELEEIHVCALVADPADERRLEYSLTVCAPRNKGRCDNAAAPFIELSFGTVGDPESSTAASEICGTVPDGAAMLPILEESIRTDNLSGFGGVEVQVELVVRGEGQPFEEAEFATKSLLYAPEIPEGRQPNRNPTVDGFTVSIDGAAPIDLPLGRCGQIEPLEVALDAELEITPVEPASAREDYVLPTFDGDFVRITEYTRYAWYATAGKWGPQNSGGPRDVAGNEPPLDSTFTAELPEEDRGAPIDVRMWFVQRDERGGQAWYESCVRIVP